MSDTETGPQRPQVEGYILAHVCPDRNREMTSVWIGVQEIGCAPVALKLAEPCGVIELRNEYEILRRLDHPGVIACLGAVETGAGLPGFVMPLLPVVLPHTLGAGLAEEDVKLFGALLLVTLEYLHAQGVTHGDLKLDNVGLSEDGSPVLFDFGSASGFGHCPEFPTCCPAALSPEVISGGVGMTPQTDLYAMGTLVRHLLTGESMTGNAETLKDIFAIHLAEAKPRLPEPLAHWQALVDKATAVDPRKRFQTAAEMRAELLQVVAQ